MPTACSTARSSPIANLIPERTYLATTLSKCIAPALRVAYLLAPDAAAEQEMRGGLQATMQMPPPLMVALVTHWLRERRRRSTSSPRSATRPSAASSLRSALSERHSRSPAKPAGHHLWLPLPEHGRADVAAHLLRNGLAVVGERGLRRGRNAAPHGLRVSLGAARNRAELSQALQVLSQAVNAPVETMQIV